MKKQLYDKTCNFCYHTGGVLILLKNIVKSFYNYKKRFPVILRQIEKMGIQSILITVVMSFFVGVVLALQSGYQLEKFNLTDMLGAIVGLSLLKELAPVQTAVLIAGKVGSSVTAELGTMKVSEEIDALHIMGIDIYNYLIFPRFVACILSTLVLVIYTDFIGFLGGALISNILYNVSFDNFVNSFISLVENVDIISNLIKAAAFGFLVILISCYYGLTTTGGAEEVGNSTTKTVVVSFMVILIANAFITKIMLYF
jgi:phospholipid/cholesterol/gamma-HCH transport system permease protein